MEWKTDEKFSRMEKLFWCIYISGRISSCFLHRPNLLGTNVHTSCITCAWYCNTSFTPTLEIAPSARIFTPSSFPNPHHLRAVWTTVCRNCSLWCFSCFKRGVNTAMYDASTPSFPAWKALWITSKVTLVLSVCPINTLEITHIQQAYDVLLCHNYGGSFHCYNLWFATGKQRLEGVIALVACVETLEFHEAFLRISMAFVFKKSSGCPKR